jgi:hypothetical protein
VSLSCTLFSWDQILFPVQKSWFFIHNLKYFCVQKDRFLFNLKSTGGEDLILFYALFRIYLGALHLHPAPQVPKQGFFLFFLFLFYFK